MLSYMHCTMLFQFSYNHTLICHLYKSLIIFTHLHIYYYIDIATCVSIRHTQLHSNNKDINL